MKWIFWGSLALIVYTYLGYPLWLWLLSRWRPCPVRREPLTPPVSIVLAVRDEARVLPQKLQNLAALNYPADKLEIILVSDGSTDATPEIARQREGQKLRVIHYPDHRGKAHALNRAIAEARGDIVVFFDARQIVEKDAVLHLVSNFSDPSVGCVTGELLFGTPGGPRPLDGMGMYWRMEKRIRQWEGVTGSVVGATGAIYAVRRNLLTPLPEETILDDLYLPLQVVRQGRRVVFEPRARAWDPLQASLRVEFRRKVRTLTGNYQLLDLAPWILTRANPLRGRFLSHKLARLFVPFALAGALVGAAMADGGFFRAAFILQLAFYGCAALALPRPRLGLLTRLANMSLAFTVLNTAAVVALLNFLFGKKEVWVR
jgi:cellulose synthase/poly-beta-1,6-N-acetylglucosamine synthase-like glycosyltransferase